MSDAELNLDPGVCRFPATIKAKCDDGMTVELDITSKCPAIRKLGEELKSIDLFEAVATPIITNTLFTKCSEFVLHAACPVPVAIVKACEVAGDLGLKKEVSMKFT